MFRCRAHRTKLELLARQKFAKKVRAAIEARVAELQGEAKTYPAKVQSLVDDNVANASETYADLVKRGETLVGRIRTQESTQETVKSAKTTVAKAKTTATQAKKTVEAGIEAADKAAAVKVAPAAKTTAAAKKSAAKKSAATTAKKKATKKAATTNASAKATATERAFGRTSFYQALQRVMAGHPTPQDLGLMDGINEILQARKLLEPGQSFYGESGINLHATTA